MRSTPHNHVNINCIIIAFNLIRTINAHSNVQSDKLCLVIISEITIFLFIHDHTQHLLLSYSKNCFEKQEGAKFSSVFSLQSSFFIAMMIWSRAFSSRQAYICVPSVYLFKLALLIISLKCTVLIFCLMLLLRLDKSRSCERWEYFCSRSSTALHLPLKPGQLLQGHEDRD